MHVFSEGCSVSKCFKIISFYANILFQNGEKMKSFDSASFWFFIHVNVLNSKFSPSNALNDIFLKLSFEQIFVVLLIVNKCSASEALNETQIDEKYVIEEQSVSKIKQGSFSVVKYGNSWNRHIFSNT